MAIKKGDRVQHITGPKGTALTDEQNGAIQVKQDDGAVATWAAGDANVLPSPKPNSRANRT